jgi:hypothetical protein
VSGWASERELAWDWESAWASRPESVLASGPPAASGSVSVSSVALASALASAWVSGSLAELVLASATPPVSASGSATQQASPQVSNS